MANADWGSFVKDDTIDNATKDTTHDWGNFVDAGHTKQKLADEKPVRDWLKTFYKGAQDINKIEITPQLRSRYEKAKSAIPDMQPSPDTNKGGVVPFLKDVASSAIPGLTGTADKIAFALDAMAGNPRQPLHGALKPLTNTSREYAKQLADEGQPEGVGKVIANTAGGLVGAYPEMAAIAPAGPLGFAAHGALGALESGGTPEDVIKASLLGGTTGMAFGLAGKSPGAIGKILGSAAAFAGPGEADRIISGQPITNPEETLANLGLGAALAIPGAGRREPTEQERIDYLKDLSWRKDQADIQQRTNTKNHEIAKLQEQYLQEQAQQAAQESQPTKLVAPEVVSEGQLAPQAEVGKPRAEFAYWMEMRPGEDPKPFFNITDENHPLAGSGRSDKSLIEAGIPVPPISPEDMAKKPTESNAGVVIKTSTTSTDTQKPTISTPPDIPTELHSSIRDFANKSVGSLKERRVIVDRKSGKVIEDSNQELQLNKELNHEVKSTSSTENRHLFNEKGEYHPDSSILDIHTHPKDNSFSDSDWMVFSENTLGEMRTVSPNKEYRIEKTKEFSDMPWIERTPKAIKDAYNRNMGIVEEKLRDMPYSESFVERVLDETSKRMADEFHLKYSVKDHTGQTATAPEPPKVIAQTPSRSVTETTTGKQEGSTVMPSEGRANKTIEPKPVETKVIEPTRVVNQHSQKLINEITGDLTEIMGEEATHLKMNLSEQSRMANELWDSNPELANSIALDGKNPPNMVGTDGHALKAEAVWVAGKNRAIESGDVEQIMKFAKNSAMQEKISQAAKSLVLLRGKNPEDPVYQIMEINKIRKDASNKRAESPKVKASEDARFAKLEQALAEKTKQLDDFQNRKTIDTMRYEVRKKGRIRAKAELDMEFKDISSILQKELASQMNVGLDPKHIRMLGQLAINRVEKGFKTIEQVVDDIHQAIGGAIDKRQIRDVISGYGRTAKLSKDEIDVQLREVKKQGRIISAIEDAEAKKPSLRSGLTRDKDTPRVTELKAQLKEAMIKNGFDIEKAPKSPEEQQQTIIERYKKHLIKREEELTTKLSNGDYETKPKSKTPLDARMTATKEHVDRLAREYRKLKQIREERSNEVSHRDAQKIVELSKRASDLKEAAVANATDRSEMGAAMQYGRALDDFYQYSNDLKLRAQKLTRPEAVHETFAHPLKTLAKVGGMSKSIIASMDASGILRQGLKVLYSKDGAKIWARNSIKYFTDMAHQFGGQDMMREVRADMYSRPDFLNGNFKKMGLDMGIIEEAFPTALPEKIPLFGRFYKASEVGFMGFQYRNRVDIAENLLKITKKMGIDITDAKELKSMGFLANMLTSRGRLKTFESKAGAINNVFFAPRFLRSNWDFMTANMFNRDVSPWVRQQSRVNLLRMVLGTSAILGIAKAMGADIVLDPRSSDFLKIRKGSTRFDITGGIASLATSTVRLSGTFISAATESIPGIKHEPWKTTVSSLTGKASPLSSISGFQRDGMDAIYQMMEGKTAPLASLAITLLHGRSRERTKINLFNELTQMVNPIGIQNAIQTAKNEDSAPLWSAIILDFLGVNASTYGKAPAKKYKPMKGNANDVSGWGNLVK